MKEKLKGFFKTAVQFILNPRLLLCFGLGWMITNGWSYVLFGLGTWLKNEWMIGVSSAYLAFLWLPVSPEKLVTVAIAIALLRWLFPNDRKTLGILKQTYADLKQTFRLKKQKRKEKKQQKIAAHPINKGSDFAMREALLEQCETFIENRDVVKAVFRMESSYMYPIGAAIITDKGKRADPERLKLCRDIIKEQTGAFSNFRGLTRLSLICMMSVDPNPEQRLKHAQQVYDLLKKSFSGSQYLCVAAMTISELVDPGYYKPMAEHTRRIYSLLKSKHPFLTGSEDSVFSALLAISKKTDERILDETEECYTLLKPHFLSNHAVQSLSHVLALCEGRPQDKCEATLSMFRRLKEEGMRYGTDFELPTLGVLAMLPTDREVIFRELREVDEYLAKQKGYGIFGLGKRQRLMHAAMIVTGDHLEHCATTQTNLNHTIMTLAAAQQAALCAAIAAATAAATSATAAAASHG